MITAQPVMTPSAFEVRVQAPPAIVLYLKAPPAHKLAAVATRAPVALPTPAPVATHPAPALWNPPLVLCPSPINGSNGEWVDLSSPPICEKEHVYGFVAPDTWFWGDPIPAWVPVRPVS